VDGYEIGVGREVSVCFKRKAGGSSRSSSSSILSRIEPALGDRGLLRDRVSLPCCTLMNDRLTDAIWRGDGTEDTVIVDLLPRKRNELKNEALVGVTAIPLSRVVVVAFEEENISTEQILGRGGMDCTSDTATEDIEAEA